MTWKHKWGEFADDLVARHVADGFPVPDHLLAPEIDGFEGVLIDAWGDLAGDRNTELGPIPYLAIDRWASRHGVEDPDDFSLLLRAIRAADRAYLAWAAEELKTRPPASQDRRG